MKFIYIVKSDSPDNPELRIPCPYIIDDFAKAFMQQFIKNHEILKKLPDGKYVVNLYKDIVPIPSESELSNSFKKEREYIEFLERPYGL